MAENSTGPAQLVLLAAVGRRYFLDGRSKVEIAEEFGFSRFKVARLLDAARESGVVHIEIRHADGIDVDLSAQLQEKFRLEHSVVVDTPNDDPDSQRQHLGQAAAKLLGEAITPQDVLGLAWALVRQRDGQRLASAATSAGGAAHRRSFAPCRRFEFHRPRP